jgi:hypothetical protein
MAEPRNRCEVELASAVKLRAWNTNVSLGRRVARSTTRADPSQPVGLQRCSQGVARELQTPRGEARWRMVEAHRQEVGSCFRSVGVRSPRRSGTVARNGQSRAGCLLLEEGGEREPEGSCSGARGPGGSSRDRYVGSYVQRHGSGGAGGSRACFVPGRGPGRNGTRWTTWKLCRSSVARPGGGRPSTPAGSTQAFQSRMLYRRLPKELPRPKTAARGAG